MLLDQGWALNCRSRRKWSFRAWPRRWLSTKRLKWRFFAAMSLALGWSASGAVLSRFASWSLAAPRLVLPPGRSATLSLLPIIPIFSTPLRIGLLLFLLDLLAMYKVYIYAALPWHLAGSTVGCNGFVQPHTECTTPGCFGRVRHLCTDLGKKIDVS